MTTADYQALAQGVGAMGTQAWYSSRLYLFGGAMAVATDTSNRPFISATRWVAAGELVWWAGQGGEGGQGGFAVGDGLALPGPAHASPNPSIPPDHPAHASPTRLAGTTAGGWSTSGTRGWCST